MCIKRIIAWLNKPEPVPEPTEDPTLQPVWAKKVLLLFGTNYIGTPYQLSGCINDVDDEKKCFETYFHNWDIKVFKGKEVVARDMYNTIKDAILTAVPYTLIRIKYSGHGTTTPNRLEADGVDEALFTENGLFTDEMVAELEAMTPDYVTVKWDLDSCMSGGMEDNVRALKANPENIIFLRNRFVINPNVSPTARVIRRIAKGNAKFVMAAGCREDQTCADATFGGRANGAYTYYNLKNLRENVSFKEEMDNAHSYLPGHGFDQDPILLGDSNRFNFKYE